MPTERGVVSRIDGNTAWVTTNRSSACEGCSSRGACHVSENEKEMEVRAVNAAGAAVGDRVVVSFQTGSYLKASFLLYVFPVLALIAGAVVGQETAGMVDMTPNTFAVICGFAFFFVSVLVVRSRSNQLAGKDEYQPKVSRVLN